MNKCLLIIVLLCYALAGCRPVITKPVAQKGLLDLSHWDFSTSGTTSLDGEWELYWKQLYTPVDFHKDSLPKLTGYMPVPDYWNDKTLGTTKLDAQGYATYRLRIKTDTTNKTLGLRIADACSAFKCWVNGVLIASNGTVGRNEQEEKPEYLPKYVYFSNKQPEIEVVIQVSNYFINRGGLGMSNSIGTQKQMLQKRETSISSTMLLTGIVLILLVYHLFIFYLRKTETTTLWISILSACIALRNLLTTERLFYDFFPTVGINLGFRMEYASAFSGVLFTTLFFYRLFPKEYSKPILKLVIWSSIAELLSIFVLPSRIYTSLLIVYDIKAILAIIFLLIVSCLALYRRRFLAKFAVLTMAIILAVGLNDILYAQNVINTAYLIPYAASLILLMQAYAIAYRFSTAYKMVENLSVELNSANVTLEQKVVERTQELTERTHELEDEKKKADELLLNILPEKTAIELKTKGKSEPRTYGMVTVMFIDMVGFTRISEHMSPELLVQEIDECFSRFDKIIGEHNLEKIKTIGDAYLCAGGLPVPNYTHAEDIIKAALEIQQFMQQRKTEKEAKGEVAFEIRIGVNTGPVVAGIVGTKKFAYDIWGDTVNTAARMEQNSEPGKINISGTTHEMVNHKFNCTYRGKIEAKHKGMTDMYYVDGENNKMPSL